MDIRPIRVSRLLLVVATASAPTAFGQPIYTVTDLGTLGGSDSWANGISNCGHIVGDSETADLEPDGQPVFRAFLWHSGIMTDLGTLGGEFSTAFAVNCVSQVVGWASRPDGSDRAYLWLAEPAFGLPSGMNALPVSDAHNSSAMDINENGQVVGRADGAFIWLPADAFSLAAGAHDLGYMSCDRQSLGINNLGVVVGGPLAWLPQANYGLEAGIHFVWPPICYSDWGYDSIDLNDQGFVLGLETSYFGPALVTTQLGEETMAAGGHEFARGSIGGVNNLGQVVAGVVLFDARRTDAHVRVELPERTRPIAGWGLDVASGISDSGLIAGVGRGSQSGESHAWLLTPIDADLDDDGRVGSPDFEGLPDCLTGPAVEPSEACAAHDFDRNGHVDLLDVQLFQWAFGSQP